MFERYTEHARRLLFVARHESSQRGHLSILPEHLLLGIVREGPGLVPQMFAKAGLSLEDARQEIERRLRAEPGRVFSDSLEIPFARSTLQALTCAVEEADRLNHTEIGESHLVLGLLRLHKEPLVSYLAEHGMTLSVCREQVARMCPGKDASNATQP